MTNIQPISICLWFDGQAEEAAGFYVSVFKDGRITKITRYGKEGFEIHKHLEGSVLTVEFEVNGQRFVGLNGGPDFKFSEAVSFMILCDTQEEIDYYWDQLSAGGDPKAQVCGWLKDKYGISWQVAPKMLEQLQGEHATPASERMMSAMFKMKKLDIATLQKAYDGE